MTIEPISKDHACHGKVLATLEVFNMWGECSVRFTPEGRDLCNQLDVGHLMLAVNGEAIDDDATVASVSIKLDNGERKAVLFSERTVPELSVGHYDLLATAFMRPQAKPAPLPRP